MAIIGCLPDTVVYPSVNKVNTSNNYHWECTIPSFLQSYLFSYQFSLNRIENNVPVALKLNIITRYHIFCNWRQPYENKQIFVFRKPKIPWVSHSWEIMKLASWCVHPQIKFYLITKFQGVIDLAADRLHTHTRAYELLLLLICC